MKGEGGDSKTNLLHMEADRKEIIENQNDDTASGSHSFPLQPDQLRLHLSNVLRFLVMFSFHKQLYEGLFGRT